MTEGLWSYYQILVFSFEICFVVKNQVRIVNNPYKSIFLFFKKNQYQKKRISIQAPENASYSPVSQGERKDVQYFYFNKDAPPPPWVSAYLIKNTYTL